MAWPSWHRLTADQLKATSSGEPRSKPGSNDTSRSDPDPRSQQPDIHWVVAPPRELTPGKEFFGQDRARFVYKMLHLGHLSSL